MTEAAWTRLDPAAEALVAELRMRRGQALRRRERVANGTSVVAFFAACAALAAVAPLHPLPSLLLLAGLVCAYALASRVEFEVGSGSAVPTQIVLVPMLFLLPPAAVPIAVAGGFLLGEVPQYLRHRFHPERLGAVVLSAWHAVGAAAVFAVAGTPEPTFAALPVLALALTAQFALEVVASTARELVTLDAPLATLLAPYRWIFTVDALLTPIGFLAAVAGTQWAGSFLLVLPLVALLRVFAQDRAARIDHALELSHAYRGTALLLGDVVEADDAYTGSHSRDVVELVVAVADGLELDARTRRRAELAALLHDVGKIRIPNEVIHKPGPLDDDEWSLMKTHTVEGERMLVRVGGLLGEVGRIVRSCHERWDGQGYPDGLAGEAIPVEARIVFVCDAFNAMTTKRAYRAPRPVEEAVAELRACAGTQFDPRAVEALAGVLGYELRAGS
jgi:HD-GYP domain-containing protein (c-di-GMP phosphodiesterase class II)